jgi:hypothetical protein
MQRGAPGADVDHGAFHRDVHVLGCDAGQFQPNSSPRRNASIGMAR